MFFAFRGNAVTANGGVVDMNAVAVFVQAAMDRESGRKHGTRILTG